MCRRTAARRASGNSSREFARPAPTTASSCLRLSKLWEQSANEAIFSLPAARAIGVRVACVSGSVPNGDEQLAAWLRADDGDSLSDRVRAAMRSKAVKGEVLGRPPYGYKVGSRRRLELIPEEAVVVRYIFRLYLNERLGIRLIARRLNEEALKTRRGGNWSMVSIRDILRNRAYLGTYARFGVRVPGSHPQLVSAEDFRDGAGPAERAAHELRAARRFAVPPVRAWPQCGYCGNKLIGVSRKQSWTRRGRRADVELVPLLPVRIADEPERVWLSHATRAVARG